MSASSHNSEAPRPSRPPPERSAETEALLTFRIGSALFGVAAELVQEIAERTDPSPIPLAPAHVTGLMPLRGEAIPLVDTARFLELPSEQEDSDLERPPRVLVVVAEGMLVGLCCDRVLGIEQVPLDSLEPPRIHIGASLSPYVTAEAHRDTNVLARLNLGALLKAARVSA